MWVTIGRGSGAVQIFGWHRYSLKPRWGIDLLSPTKELLTGSRRVHSTLVTDIIHDDFRVVRIAFDPRPPSPPAPPAPPPPVIPKLEVAKKPTPQDSIENAAPVIAAHVAPVLEDAESFTLSEEVTKTKKSKKRSRKRMKKQMETTVETVTIDLPQEMSPVSRMNEDVFDANGKGNLMVEKFENMDLTAMFRAACCLHDRYLLRSSRPLKAPEIKRDDLKAVLSKVDHKFKKYELVGDGVLYLTFLKAFHSAVPDCPNNMAGNARTKLVRNASFYPWAIAYNLPRAREIASVAGGKSVSDIFEAYVGCLYEEDQGNTKRIEEWCAEILHYVLTQMLLQFTIMKIEEFHISTTNEAEGRLRCKIIAELKLIVNSLPIPPLYHGIEFSKPREKSSKKANKYPSQSAKHKLSEYRHIEFMAACNILKGKFGINDIHKSTTADFFNALNEMLSKI